MNNPTQTAAMNKSMREGFEEVKKKMQTTFAGFDFEFNTGKAADFSKEEREELYEQLYHAGK
jgi:acetone monooxygenase